MNVKQKTFWETIALVVLVAIISSFLTTILVSTNQKQIITYLDKIPGININQKDIDNANQNQEQTKVVKEESAVISAVENSSPAVVSIVASKDLPIIERYYQNPFDNDFFQHFFGNNFGIFNFKTPPEKQNGTQKTKKTEISKGTGFIVSNDGYIVTNKHVVAYDDVEYTVLMNNEEKYTAQVMARDPINDLAIIKIDAENLPTIQLGESDNLKVGQTVIAIGNALGEFDNTVSTGVISGLSRSIMASSIGFNSEELIDVIQTDASINPGNSGGPLLNISGQVIGINTAMANGAQNIGFAIPVNEVKKIVDDVKEHGRLITPWLGLRYLMINKTIAEKNNLDLDYGALIVRGEEAGDLAIIPGSPADKADLVENDIILEIEGQKIDGKNPLNKIISQYDPSDKIKMKIMHRGEEKEIEVTLEEKPEN